MSGKLYVVGTPIGNLGDISPRALETLERCDFIAAEDTRVTLKLLNHFNIKKQLVSYHEHNKLVMGANIVERLSNGENCALVTDAGMPAISDPGEDLVRLCHESGLTVESVPGPCAFAAALSVAGVECGRFTFEGFLSVNKPNRREHLESLINESRTMVFYEAPHKLKNTLADLYRFLGNRCIAIVHELTKIHESVIRTDLESAQTLYPEEKLKGEFVLIVSGKKPEKKPEMTIENAVQYAIERMNQGVPKTQAAKDASRESGFKKSEIYDLIKDV